MRKILYIINPISGLGARNGLQQLVEEKSKQHDVPFFIYPSVASGDYSFLHSIVKEKKITDVVIAGGDGTISQVVGDLMKLDLNFGIIPCGSGNGLAHALKIPKHSGKAIDTVFNHQPEQIDGFMVNDRFACMLAGLGFDAKVAHDFAAEPKRGLATYIRLSLKNFFLMRPHNFRMRIDKVKLDIDAYFVSVANSNQFGNNFTIAPKASLSDGLLDIVIVTKQNKVSFIVQTLRQLAGWNALQTTTHIEDKRAIIYFQAEKITIENPSLAPLHVDGEPMEPTEKISIEVKKKCFRVIHPS